MHSYSICSSIFYSFFLLLLLLLLFKDLATCICCCAVFFFTRQFKYVYQIHWTLHTFSYIRAYFILQKPIFHFHLVTLFSIAVKTTKKERCGSFFFSLSRWQFSNTFQQNPNGKTTHSFYNPFHVLLNDAKYYCSCVWQNSINNSNFVML